MPKMQDKIAICRNCSAVKTGDRVVVIHISRVLLWTHKQNVNIKF